MTVSIYSDRLRMLAVDMGTGTQDILLFESDRTSQERRRSRRGGYPSPCQYDGQR